MSTWEERMAQRTRARKMAGAEVKRRAFLGEAFLKFWPPDEGPEYGFEPQTEILPEIIAARCLGIKYGDPGPRLDPGMCRVCWGDRHIWLGNTWGIQHLPPGRDRCHATCHEGEVWLAAAGTGT